MESLNSFPHDLKIAKEMVYDQCSFDFKNPQLNAESIEYSACSFELDGKKIQYRVSKITPTKKGQFVTIWKRNQNGITEPFDINDEIDFIIIATKKDEHFGQFIFPKKVLVDKGIITQNGKSGKRGIRVYSPWDETDNKQAKKTQNWQLNYFLTINEDNFTDFDLAKNLLAVN